ncbi:alpha/beta fold hydrolase [Sphingomonas sp. ID0503]|uniref:alpha/beta fold hydrolase n=1 Tax=Sphingomonas sp. ID0503 TaxID=3399691 RepID=UPI003AFAEF3A
MTSFGEIVGPTSHTFVSQRLRLRYVDWGNPTAPLLLMVHGGMDHSRNWDWLAAELRHDFHVIAPDLRGHGDSDHSPDGNYRFDAFVYDLAQLIHQQETDQVSIIAHSYGGMVSLRYAGVFPEKLRRMIVIEGIGAPKQPDEIGPLHDRFRAWTETLRGLSGRVPRRYPDIDTALKRMMAENKHLSEARARHLTIHGLLRNEDGTYSWKYDNYFRTRSPIHIPDEELEALFGRITCPVLLAWGRQSFFQNPEEAGLAGLFTNARTSLYDNAGHWVHHDRHDDFLAEARAFLA